MTFVEANKIFQVWKSWYWPFDFILGSVFLAKKPKSFLPFPEEVLEEALNIVAKYYFDAGDIKLSKLIQESIPAIWQYTDDEAAFKEASATFSKPEMREIILLHINKFKNDWINSLIKQKESNTFNPKSN